MSISRSSLNKKSETHYKTFVRIFGYYFSLSSRYMCFVSDFTHRFVYSNLSFLLFSAEDKCLYEWSSRSLLQTLRIRHIGEMQKNQSQLGWLFVAVLWCSSRYCIYINPHIVCVVVYTLGRPAFLRVLYTYYCYCWRRIFRLFLHFLFVCLLALLLLFRRLFSKE